MYGGTALGAGVYRILMRKVLKPLRYVFFRVLMSKLRDPSEPLPILVASTVTLVLLLFNVMGLTMIINIVMGHRDLLPAFPGGRPAMAVVFVGCALLAYHTMRSAWAQGTGYANLVKEFAPDPHQDGIRTALFWSYVVVSGALPVLLAVFWPRA
jgi:hypothetical protein